MEQRDIVVIGGSAGAFEPLGAILAALPAELSATVCVVLHRPAHAGDMLCDLLSRRISLRVRSPVDGERMEPRTVYVAPADCHLILKKDHVRLTKGPRENQWRPAIDVLFRSAAVALGPRVTGVILSGALDDGSAGLAAIKRCGGVAIVQTPADALVSDMPDSAIRNARIDHIVPAQEMASVIKRVVEQPTGPAKEIPQELILETEIAETGRTSLEVQERLGELSPFTCSDCGGPLWKQHGEGLRFRCLTGHALSARALECGLDHNLDAALWAAIRQFEQRTNLQQAMAADEEKKGRSRTASSYRDRAAEARSHAETLRKLLLTSATLHSMQPSTSVAQSAAD
jgi:two-component system chemotaxis response regulator CheB